MNPTTITPPANRATIQTILVRTAPAQTPQITARASAPARHTEAAPLRLRVHVLHLPTGWFADIDDENDRQSDDPYWYQDGCNTQHEAVDLGCNQLAQMLNDLEAVIQRGRISESTTRQGQAVA